MIDIASLLITRHVRRIIYQQKAAENTGKKGDREWQKIL